MKILIIKLSAFGDIIHALPALDDLLRRPEVREVHWLIDARFGFVAELLPPTVTCHIVALKGRHGLRNGIAMASALRQRKFDHILDLQGLIKSGLMARAIGAPVYGFDRQQSPEWPNRWLVTPVPFHPEERHVVQCYRRIAAAPFNGNGGSGTPTPPLDYHAPTIQLQENAVVRAQQSLAEWQVATPFALFHVGGSYPTKRLPNAQWRQLAATIAEQQPVIILWGSAEEQQRAQAISEGLNQVMAAPKRLAITTLAGMLSLANGYIGPDSGVTHLAAAVHCPTVTLWGPTAPWRMGAQDPLHRHVVAQTPCAPCFQRHCDHFICMPALSPQEIITAFAETQSTTQET
ncbi:MAG: glycosyltransferase family 9 protein [Mariprofundales bacterium]|nr:glycosyltransferase family 9 protein [Mariprofundales bacterium]